MTPYQLKAARALLGWTRMQLALRSATSEHIVTILERRRRIARLDGQTEQGDLAAAIRATLETAGVEFTNGRAPEVRVRGARQIMPDQVKAARKLLGWSRMQLGLLSNTSINLVRTFERSGRVAALYSRDRTVPVDALAAIRATLEAAGIEFTNGWVPGARLRKPDH